MVGIKHSEQHLYQPHLLPLLHLLPRPRPLPRPHPPRLAQLQASAHNRPERSPDL
jgi:hypothetical protein